MGNSTELHNEQFEFNSLINTEPYASKIIDTVARVS